MMNDIEKETETTWSLIETERVKKLGDERMKGEKEM